MNELLLRALAVALLAVPTRAPVTLAQANEDNFFNKVASDYEPHGYSWLSCPVSESIPTFTLHQVKKSWIEAMRECPKDGQGSMLASVRTEADYNLISQMLSENRPALNAASLPGKEMYSGAWIALNAIDAADVWPYSRAARGEVPDMKVNIPTGSPQVVFSNTQSTNGVQFGNFAGNPQTTPFWFGYSAYGWRWAEVKFKIDGSTATGYDMTDYIFNYSSGNNGQTPADVALPGQGRWGKITTGFTGQYGSLNHFTHLPSNLQGTTCMLDQYTSGRQPNQANPDLNDLTCEMDIGETPPDTPCTDTCQRAQPDNSGGIQRCALIMQGGTYWSGLVQGPSYDGTCTHAQSIFPIP